MVGPSGTQCPVANGTHLFVVGKFSSEQVNSIQQRLETLADRLTVTTAHASIIVPSLSLAKKLLLIFCYKYFRPLQRAVSRSAVTDRGSDLRVKKLRFRLVFHFHKTTGARAMYWRKGGDALRLRLPLACTGTYVVSMAASA